MHPRDNCVHVTEKNGTAIDCSCLFVMLNNIKGECIYTTGRKRIHKYRELKEGLGMCWMWRENPQL